MAPRGRYNLIRKIADGGTAEVFLAHMEGSAGFKRLVVLKRVLPALWADENFRRGLIDEAHIAMGLHHSNIVQVLDLGVANERYFLVFELVDGWTLSQIVRRMHAAKVEMPLNLMLHIMAEVCRALAYAHSRAENGVPLGIVHRDVTPQNVLLSEQGEVKLTDFGIARARTRATTSQIGMVKGKPAFMSPEQAEGLTLDARSDLFPIGTMLYQLAIGELPFGAGSGPEAMVRIIGGRYVPPSEKRPDLPREFVRLITKALEHDPKNRFQTADEMLRAIEKVQRTVLEPAGQTELKAWLAELSAKDLGLPLTRATEAAPPPAPQDTSEPIELRDEDILRSTEQPAAVSAKPVQRAPPWLWVTLAAVAAAAAYFVVNQPTPTSPTLERPAEVTAVVDARATEVQTEAVVSRAEAVVEPVTLDAAVEEISDAAVEEQVTAPDAASALEDSPADAAVDAADAGSTDVEAVVDAGVVDPLPAASRTPDAGVKATPTIVKAPSVPVAKAPVSASAAADDMVSVQVESEPVGATLRIDRKTFGKTPIPIRLKVGIAFELEVSKEGYRTSKTVYFVTRKAGQKVRINLARGP